MAAIARVERVSGGHNGFIVLILVAIAVLLMSMCSAAMQSTPTGVYLPEFDYVNQKAVGPVPYTLANGVALQARTDGHAEAKHGAAALSFFQSRPYGEIWYRDIAGEEVFLLLGNDGQHNLWCGLIIGARGMGTLRNFVSTMLSGRLVLTGWCGDYDKCWMKIVARDGFQRIFP